MKRIALSFVVMGIGLVLVAGVPWSATAHASKLYGITGEVVKVTPRTVSIRSGTNVYEFSRAEHLGLPKIGDRITILYHLDAQQITPAAQGAGTVPGVEKGPEDRGLGHGTWDDRAFYNAEN